LLTILVRVQNRRVNQNNLSERREIDFLANIRTIYNNGEINLAYNAKCFTEIYDGVIHQNCLCLYGKQYKKKLCKSYLQADYNDVLDSLEAQDALKRGTDRRTIQISATGGKRFYAIPIEKIL